MNMKWDEKRVIMKWELNVRNEKKIYPLEET